MKSAVLRGHTCNRDKWNVIRNKFYSKIGLKHNSLYLGSIPFSLVKQITVSGSSFIFDIKKKCFLSFFINEIQTVIKVVLPCHCMLVFTDVCPVSPIWANQDQVMGKAQRGSGGPADMLTQNGDCWGEIRKWWMLVDRIQTPAPVQYCVKPCAHSHR